jgi:hypothetical protein
MCSGRIVGHSDIMGLLLVCDTLALQVHLSLLSAVQISATKSPLPSNFWQVFWNIFGPENRRHTGFSHTFLSIVYMVSIPA